MENAIKKQNKFARAMTLTWGYIKKARLELLVLALWIFVDLFTKAMVQRFMEVNDSLTLIGGFLNFTFIFNHGGAGGFTFGLSRGALRIFFIVFTILAMGAFSFFMFRFRGKHKLARLSFAFIIGGAFGNFYDRAFVRAPNGYFGVRDFIHFFPNASDSFVFNLADVALIAGVVMFAIYFIFMHKFKEKKMGPILDTSFNKQDGIKDFSEKPVFFNDEQDNSKNE